MLKSVNFSQVEWSKTEEEVYYNASNSVEVAYAQAEEQAKWKQYGVYTEVEDTGQPAITTRWVLTEKSVEGVRMVKARLVVRGYEEEASNIRPDSPTVCRENLWLVSTIAVSNKWKIHSMDVKSAFLQGFPIECVVHVIPPPEANTSNLWELRKTVYGLNNASRSWYLKAWDEIKKKGAVKSTFDNALFFWRPCKKLEGLICFHVDYFFFAGSQQFHNTVIDHLRSQFQLSKESLNQMLYTGIEYSQAHDEKIIIHQTEYTAKMEPLRLPNMSKNRALDALEVRQFNSFSTSTGFLNEPLFAEYVPTQWVSVSQEVILHFLENRVSTTKCLFSCLQHKNIKKHSKDEI